MWERCFLTDTIFTTPIAISRMIGKVRVTGAKDAFVTVFNGGATGHLCRSYLTRCSYWAATPPSSVSQWKNSW